MTKRRPRKSPSELEAEADAILAKDREERWLGEIAALRGCYEELVKPSNDPEYLKKLKATEATRNEIANKIASVHIVPDNGKTWIGVGLTNPRHHADALEVARMMGEHFEARVITHETEG